MIISNNCKMAKRIDTIWKLLAAAVLGLLGFASCGKEEAVEQILAMYGQPHAFFKAIGSVKDEKGKPIEGIRVSITRHNYHPNTSDVTWVNNNSYEYDVLYTDSKGAYQLIESIFEGPDNVVLVFEDIDGDDHGGNFESVRTTPSVKQTEKGDGLWYGGAFEVKSNVKMKKK